MADPHWTSYAALVTSIGAAIISVVSLARASRLKTLALRLELRKAFTDLDALMSGVDAYFAFVFESHRRVMSAEGQNQSGAFHAFVADHAKEMDAFRKLKAMQPKQPAHYDGHSPEELENIRVAVYQFSGQVQKLREKYAAVWDSDEKRRAEIRSRNKG